jgi:hypothetical protein
MVCAIAVEVKTKIWRVKNPFVRILVRVREKCYQHLKMVEALKSKLLPQLQIVEIEEERDTVDVQKEDFNQLTYIFRILYYCILMQR